jgi:hypothetical protein
MAVSLRDLWIVFCKTQAESSLRNFHTNNEQLIHIKLWIDRRLFSTLKLG